MAKARTFVIKPPQRFASMRPAELWSFRALLWSLASRRIKSTFDRQYLAYMWPVFRPVLMVAMFTLFRHLSDSNTSVTMPYPLYVYAGLAMWFFFIETIQYAATSLKQNAGIIQKVYFPRIFAPLAAILAQLYTFSVTVIPLAVLMVIYSTAPGWNLLLLPVVLLQACLLIFGLGCIFAALGLGSADWDKFLTFALYIGLFLSPVIYSPEMMPDNARFIYSLNPTVGMLEAFRATLFSPAEFPWREWLYSCAFSVVVCALGVLMFQNVDEHISDRL